VTRADAAGAAGVAAALDRAAALLAVNRAADAVRLLETAVATYPDHSMVWGQLAAALLAADDADRALAAAGRCVALAPGDEWGQRLASLALSRLGWHAEAVAAARAAVRLGPGQWRPRARLASALADSPTATPVELDEAWYIARDVGGQEPDEPDVHFLLGRVALARQDWEPADAAFRRVLALQPDDAAARTNLTLVELHRAVRRRRPAGVAGVARGFAEALATDPTMTVAADNMTVAARVTVIQALWWPQSLGLLFLLGPWGTGIGTIVLVPYLAVGWMRLPRSLRRFYRRLPRTHPQLRGLLVVTAVSWLAALLVVPLFVYVDVGLATFAALVAVAVPVGTASTLRNRAHRTARRTRRAARG
jgi:tetratricopeptide (TPR) repeat protein